jgi:deoxyadenosine/deoxycytidine kinase
MHFIFSIEGNIGSGKSTLVEFLKKSKKNIKLSNLPIVYLQEPVDQWDKIKNENGISILEEFYKDPKTWAFSFQMMAYISRLSLLKKTIRENPDSIIITERSTFTDRNVFAKMLYDEKNISHIDYQIYNTWFGEFVKELTLSGIIYVKTSPNKCSERIKKRNRIGENIEIKYLNKCAQYHDDWIEPQDNVLFLNGDIDFTESNEVLNKRIRSIFNFIFETPVIKKSCEAIDFEEKKTHFFEQHINSFGATF